MLLRSNIHEGEGSPRLCRVSGLLNQSTVHNIGGLPEERNNGSTTVEWEAGSTGR